MAGVTNEALESLHAQRDDLFIAMDNCPHQQVVCALSQETAEWFEEKLTGMNALSARLPFDRAYHTPAFQSFCDGLHPFFDQLTIRTPHTALYSCMSAAPMPDDRAEIRRLAINQWANRVRFRETVERVYADGISIFVECGPRNNLSAFVDDILKGRPHLAVPLDVEHRDGITQANHLIAQLAIEGVAMSLANYYPGAGASPVAAAAGAARGPTKLKTGPIILKTGLQGFALAPRPAPVAAPVVAAAPIDVAALTPIDAAARARERTPHSEPPPFVAPLPETPAFRTPAPILVAPREQVDAAPFGHAVAGTGVALAAAPGSEFSNGLSHVAQDAQDWQDGQEEVLGAYFQTMESFLRSQQDVMHSFLAAEQPAAVLASTLLREPSDAPPLPPATSTKRAPNGSAGNSYGAKHDDRLAAAPERFPLLHGATVREHDGTLVAVVTIDVRDSCYLEDHTIGRGISTVDPHLLPLAVVPLTFSMELMAEAAALATQRRVVGMREVRAQRWIGLDRSTIDLEILVRKTAHGGADEIQVMVRPAPQRGAGSPRLQPTFIEGFMVLGEDLPEAPVAAPWRYSRDRPARWEPAQIYDEIMFHGPRLRAIHSMDLWAADGSEGTLIGMPHDRLFSWTTQPQFCTDAISLDAAGQLIGMWTSDHLERGFHVFPFRMERLDIFGANLAPGETAKCRAKIALIGDSEVRSDIEIVGADGTVRCRIEGWWDKRFDLPDRFFRLRRAPARNFLARPLEGFSGTGLAVKVIDDLSLDFLESSSQIWMRVLAKLALTYAERETWQAMQAVPIRRVEWLLGRAAAKDAVRELLRDAGITEACAADIDILAEEFGRPVLSDKWPQGWGSPPRISIAHKDGRAVAIAGSRALYDGVGIDIETIEDRPESFVEAAFTPRERALIARAAGERRAITMTRIWCAKEAVGKALGRGLSDILDLLEAEDCGDDGNVRIFMAAAPPERATGLKNAGVLEVKTIRDGGYLIALVAIPATK